MPLREFRLPGLTALVLLAAAAASAQDGGMAACVADSYDPNDCLGVISGSCTQAAREDTTLTTVGCIEEETEAWDVMLNAEYQTTMTVFREADASGDVAGTTRESALKEAQRAWIAFRDAECGLRYAQWGNGSMRQIAAANCLMEETAERAIALRQMREP
jgi:uncharacterized protein YecT (DUF1311 family)